MARKDVAVRGPLLTRERLTRLLTIEEAASHIGISRGALARAESGGPVRIETVRLLAEYYALEPKLVLVLDDEAA